MRKLLIIIIIFLTLVSCKQEVTIEPDNIEPEYVDPAYWFKDIYEDLIRREAEKTIGPKLNNQYIFNNINQKWQRTLSPADGTETQDATCKHLLETIDLANNNLTSYGSSKYAAAQYIDSTALNDCINRLIKKEGEEIYDVVEFVTVGNRGAIAYSTDGMNWTTITAGSDNWRSVVYGNGKFVAVGYNRGLAYSINGVNWTMKTLDAGYWDITFGNDLFVAVGYSGSIAYSQDGINWEEITVGENSWSSITYGNGMYVAGGNGEGRMAFSYDGIDWIEYNLDTASWLGITYGNGNFYAVGYNPYGKNNMAYSNDGINWTLNIAESKNRWENIVYGNNRFITVGSNGKIAYSVNGTQWVVTAIGNYTFKSVAYGNNKYIACNSIDGKIIYSTNGTDWEIIEINIENKTKDKWYGITFRG